MSVLVSRLNVLYLIKYLYLFFDKNNLKNWIILSLFKIQNLLNLFKSDTNLFTNILIIHFKFHVKGIVFIYFFFLIFKIFNLK